MSDRRPNDKAAESDDQGQDLSLTDYMAGNISKDPDDSKPPETTTNRRQRDEWPPREYEDDELESDASPIATKLGQLGVVLAVGAVVLAVLGIFLAFINIQPAGNTAMVLSLGLVMVAMLFGVIFQISDSNFRIPDSD